MRKLLITAVILLSMTAQSQIKGVDYDNAKSSETLSEMVYEQWIILNGTHVMSFKHNTVGVKHSIEKLYELLNANDMRFGNTFRDSSYLPSYVDGYSDYSGINTSTSVGSGEILKLWGDENNAIGWMINENVIIISILNN